jgi:hypothetical protein
MNNMRKHAFLNGNVVVKVESISEETWYEQIAFYSSIIDIEDSNLAIEAGWYFSNQGFSEGPEYVEPVPESVTPRQVRLALLAFGVTEEMINASIDAFEDPLKSQARIAWEYSTLFFRSNPLIAFVQAALQWTDEQVDALWIAASKI